MKSFKTEQDRLDIFLEMVEILADLPYTQLKQIAVEAEVCVSTLYKWIDPAGTVAPRINTLFRVGNVLGFELHWKRAAGKKPKLRLVV